MRILRITYLLLLTHLGQFFSLYGEKGESAGGIALEAENPLIYDDGNQTVTASGNAMLIGDGIILNADRIIWDRNASIVQADGCISLGVTGYRLLADSLLLDLGSGTFTAENVKTGLYPWIVQADQMVATDSNYTLSNALLIHENHNRLSPSLRMHSAVYDINSTTIFARGIGLNIDGKTLGQIPRLKRNLKGKESRIEFLGGQREPLGWYAGIRFDLLDEKNFSADIETISYFDRGIFLGPQFSYLKDDTQGSSYSNWQANLGGINDDGDIPLGSRGDAIDQERGFVNIRGVSRWDDNWRIALDMSTHSDSEVYRDYEREGFEENQWYNNAFEIGYDGEDFRISVTTRWQGNKFQSQAETTPNVMLTYGPKALWNEWTQESFQIEYSETNSKNNFGQNENSYTKFDFGHKTASTFEITKGLRYIPSLSFRWQTFDIDNANKYTRSFWESGNELSFSLHADYPWKNQVWKTDSLRHAMTFSVGHHHVHTLKKSDIPSSLQIEPYLENPNLGPVELLNYLDSDNLTPYEVIRAGWEQELLGQKNGIFTRWADIQFYQDIWVDSKSLLNSEPHFYGQARIYPARWLSLELQSKINTERGELNRSAYGFTVLDGIKNEINVHYLSYNRLNDQLQTRLFHRINQFNTIYGAVRYDPGAKIFPYWAGVLSINKPTGWEWSISLSQRRATARENDLSWGVGVNLFSF